MDKPSGMPKGHISPKTQKEQQAKQEKLAAALRANLRRRKMAGEDKKPA